APAGLKTQCPNALAGPGAGSGSPGVAGYWLGAHWALEWVACCGALCTCQYVDITHSLPFGHPASASLRGATSERVKGHFRRAVQTNVYHRGARPGGCIPLHAVYTPIPTAKVARAVGIQSQRNAAGQADLAAMG